jgi:glycosyltransferase involved in cell wall biosynthesis
MHVLMISLDTGLLTQKIGNTRARHEAYAAQVGKISIVVCNRRGPTLLPPYESDRVVARATESRSYFHYVLDGYRLALRLIQESEQPVDLITTQDPFLTGLIGLMLRRCLKVPLLIQDHNSFLESKYFAEENPRNILLRTLANWILRRADAIRVVNHQEKRGCIRRGIPAEKVCAIPVVPDIKGFTATDLAPKIQAWRDKLTIDPNKPVVLWVGRPVTFKNLPMLVKAIKRIHAEKHEVQFVLAGDMTGTTIPAMVNEYGLAASVRLPGAVPHVDLPALYQMADVYAMSSNYEGLPVVLLEASAARIAIVSTNNNGALDLIKDGETGLLVPIGDDQALASKVITLLNDPEKRKSLGTAAREHVLKAYDEQALTDQWVQMWRDVVEGNPLCAS